MVINKRMVTVFGVTLGIILTQVLLLFPRNGSVVLVIVGVIWFVFQIWRHSTFTLSKGFLAWGIIVIYLIGYAQFSRPIPGVYIFVQRMLIAAFFFFLIYTSLRSNQDRIPWENGFVLLAIVASLINLLDVFLWYQRYWKTVHELQVVPAPQIAYRPGSLMHPNPLAGFLNLVWPIIGIRLLKTKSKSRKLVWGAIAGLLGISFIYTNSRGGMLGLFVGLAVFLMMAVLLPGIQNADRAMHITISKKQRLALFAILGGVISLAGIIFWRSLFTGQFQSTVKHLSGRSTIWMFSWEAFLEKPIWGQGIVSFPIDYTRLAALPPGVLVPSAHNLWLQIGADYGLIGLIFMGFVVSLLIFRSIQRTLPKTKSQQWFLAIAYLAGGTAYLTQDLVDFLPSTLLFGILLIVFLTLFARYALDFGDWELNRWGYALIGFSILALFAVWEWGMPEQLIDLAENQQRIQSAQAPMISDWEAVCLSYEQHPQNAMYKFECSQAIAWEIADAIQNGEDVDTKWEQAIAVQKKGYEQNPYWSTQEINLAVLYWGTGDRSTAFEHAKHTTDVFPMYDVALLNMGWMAEQLGDPVTALNAYTRTLRVNPLINRSLAAQNSELLATAADDLKLWEESEEIWGEWYDDSRHDRVNYESDYWKGVIALALGEPRKAIPYFETALSDGKNSVPLYVYLTYAYDLSGQQTLAFQAAQDVALMHQNNIRRIKSPVLLSIIASILQKNGDMDLAYSLFLESYHLAADEIVYEKYYPMVYGQQILFSDISPWVIRTDLILVDTQGGWTWFVQEAKEREDAALAEKIALWYRQIPGIALLEEN